MTTIDVGLVLAGLALAVFFYAGLWWTTGRALASPLPALWFLGSFLVRGGVVVSALYLLTGGQWRPLLILLPGWVLGRVLVMLLTRHRADNLTDSPEAAEGRHASKP